MRRQQLADDADVEEEEVDDDDDDNDNDNDDESGGDKEHDTGEDAHMSVDESLLHYIILIFICDAMNLF